MSSKEVLVGLQKQYGPSIGKIGGGYYPAGRIPTGIFPLDLALGGGFPRAKMSMICGLESSGKSLILYKLLSQVQSEGKVAVLVDVEGSYDLEWATLLGVDTKKLVYILPSTAEEAIDAIDGFMNSDDVGIVGLDSIAALCSQNEVESAASKMIVAGVSQMIGKLSRKITSALNRQRSSGYIPAFISVNQVRYKVGVMYGNPEVFPGGIGLMFYHSLILRMYGKNKMVKEISSEVPAFREISGIVKKSKVPVVSLAFEYDICLVPHGKLNVGDVDAWNTVSNYAKKVGLISKTDNGWKAMGSGFKTLEAMKDHYYEDSMFSSSLRSELIKVIKPVHKNVESVFKKT